MFELHEFKSPNSCQDNPLEGYQAQQTGTSPAATARPAATIEAASDDAPLSGTETILLLAALSSVLVSLWMNANALF